MASEPDLIENRTFDEIGVGDSASLTRVMTPEDAALLAVVAGDAALPPAAGQGRGQGEEVAGRAGARELLGAGLILAVLGTRLPGAGTVHLEQSLAFLRPVAPGDRITATVTVAEKIAGKGELWLDCACTDQTGAQVVTGRARVRAPAEKLRLPRGEPTEVRFSRHDRFRDLLAQAAAVGPVTVAVAHPCSAAAVEAAVEAARAGLIRPILVGPKAKVDRAAAEAGVDIAPFERIDAPHSDAAAAAAVALVRAGRAEVLMKGSLHTDELLHAVVDETLGLRTKRRLSHVYLMDVPRHPRPLLITDAAVNIAPSLADKRDIVQNAIDLAHVMGIVPPKVAILSAVETVNPRIPSTLDAAALCKMADRGQITGALVDGPLAFDNAVNAAAAAEKGIVSPVAGQADILVVPDLEAGNMLAKQLTFLAGADAAGVVLGARVPIVLTSRADSERTRLASCAVAVLIARAPMPGLGG